jgi:hypothetical protein
VGDRELGSEAPIFLRRALVFVVVGLALYLGLYAAAEYLVYRHAERNRFFMIRSAPPATYDYVILGASHSAAFDYGAFTQAVDDWPAMLEERLPPVEDPPFALQIADGLCGRSIA